MYIILIDYKYYYAEKELTRHRFATIDMADNYSFHYESGFSDETLFPGR